MDLPTTAADWAELLAKRPRDRPYFTDAEAVSLSGVTVGGLRRLQAVGAITAIKAPKAGGGAFRVWGGDAVYIARIAGEMQRSMRMEITKAGAILKFVDRETIDNIVKKYDGRPMPEPDDENAHEFYDRANEGDWCITTYDNDIVCLEKIDGSAIKIIGWLSSGRENFFGTPDMEPVVVENTMKQLLYCRYKTALNISMSLRDVYFYRWSDAETLESDAASFSDEE